MTHCTALQSLALHNFKENIITVLRQCGSLLQLKSLQGVPISLFFLSLIMRAETVQHHATLRWWWDYLLCLNVKADAEKRSHLFCHCESSWCIEPAEDSSSKNNKQAFRGYLYQPTGLWSGLNRTVNIWETSHKKEQLQSWLEATTGFLGGGFG